MAIYRHFNLPVDYMPDRLQAPLHVCWARDSRNRTIMQDADWSGFTMHADRVGMIESDHYGMLQEPHVARIARLISEEVENMKLKAATTETIEEKCENELTPIDAGTRSTS
jgi:thioesterase domain-containing protein